MRCPLKPSYCKEHCKDGKECMNKDWYGPDVKAWAETEDNYIKQDDIIAELERENAMMRARNERLEHEIVVLETALNNANRALLNLCVIPEWFGLTDEDIDDLWKTEYFNLHYELPKAIEAKLKEKNHGKA